jgi:hypothetical protein
LTLSGTAFTGWLMQDESRLAMLPSIPAIVAPLTDGPPRAERPFGSASHLRAGPFSSGDALLPDGKLKREPQRRQDALRSDFQIVLSRRKETLP